MEPRSRVFPVEPLSPARLSSGSAGDGSTCTYQRACKCTTCNKGATDHLSPKVLGLCYVPTAEPVSRPAAGPKAPPPIGHLPTLPTVRRPMAPPKAKQPNFDVPPIQTPRPIAGRKEEGNKVARC